MSTIISTSFKLPSYVVSNGLVTGNAWLNPNNILLVDSNLSESNPSQGSTSDIIIGGFNPNLAQNAIITGIEMNLIAKRGSQTVPPLTLTVYAVDNTSGQNVYYPYIAPIDTLTETLDTYLLGTSNYKFATSFTIDQINNLKFQLVANGDIYVDSFLMKVFYYIPDTTTPDVIVAGSCETCNSPIQVQEMSLQLPFLVGDSKFYLKPGSFSYPDGTPVALGDMGGCGGEITFVFDEGKAKGDNGNNEFEENAIFKTSEGYWTVLPSGVIEINLGSVSNRGIPFHQPFTHVAALMSDHAANSKVIISNSAYFESTHVRRCQADSVFSLPVTVSDENTPLTDSLHDLDFRGAGVVVANDITDPHKKIVTIAGANGTTPPSIVSTITNTSNNTQVTTLSADLVISGLNRGAIIEISTEEAQTVTSVTVGGVSAVQSVTSTDAINNLRSEIWVCVNPPLGSQAVVITLSGDAYLTFGAECISGINTSSPTGATQSATGTSLTPTLSITTTTDNSNIIDSLTTGLTPILYTQGAGQALNWSKVTNGITRQGGSSVEPTGLTPDVITMDYSITQNTPWVYCAVEIKGIAIGSPTGIQSINGDTTSAQTIVGAGGATVNTVGGVTTITAGGGSGTTNIFIDQTPDNGTYGLLAGAINGINTTFTVSQGVYVSGKLSVFLNGLLNLQGATSDWVETTPGSGIFDFITAPATGDIITAEYVTGNSTTGTGSIVEVQSDTFSLTTVAGEQVTVWVKGELTNTTVSNGTGASLQYNGVTKDRIEFLDYNSYSKIPFSMMYTETPGAGTHDIVILPDTFGSISNPVIMVMRGVNVGGGNSSQSSNGVFSKDLQDASTVQIIPHGLTGIPTKVRLNAVAQPYTNVNGSSNGVFSSNPSLNQSCIYAGATAGTPIHGNSATEIAILESNNGGNDAKQVGILSVDATNIYISWTKSLGTLASSYSCMWEAEI